MLGQCMVNCLLMGFSLGGECTWIVRGKEMFARFLLLVVWFALLFLLLLMVIFKWWYNMLFIDERIIFYG